MAPGRIDSDAMEGSLADQLAAKLEHDEVEEAPTSALGQFAAIVEKSSGIDAESVTREKSLQDLGIGSLSTIEITVHCEETFGILLDDDLVASFQTVGEMVDYLGENGSKQAK